MQWRSLCLLSAHIAHMAHVTLPNAVNLTYTVMPQADAIHMYRCKQPIDTYAPSILVSHLCDVVSQQCTTLTATTINHQHPPVARLLKRL